MNNDPAIPTFTLYGENDQFPDVVHCEPFSVRAALNRWRIAAHRHSQLVQLLVVNKGKLDAKVDGVSYRLSDGSFLFLPAHCVHEFVFQPDTLGQVISVPLNVVNSIGPAADDLRNALNRPFFGLLTDDITCLANMLFDAAKDQGSLRTQRAVSLAHSVLCTIAEVSKDDLDSHGTLTQARLTKLDQLIVENMGGKWTASDYASALSITTGHLSRLCRAAKGVGAAAYIEESTIEEACRLLAFTQLPISQVGYRLGYNDPSYFSKRFRAARGQSPTDYRDQFSG